MKKVYGKISNALAIGAIVCLGTIVYSNTFFVPFVFDDKFSIVSEPFIRNIYNIQDIWYILPRRFILYLSLALNYHFNGLHVWGYHVFNLGVHLVASILVWWLTLLTFSTPALKNEKIARHANVIALLAGLVFVAHPVQTEAVTYIVQRAASMAAMFYLASLCLYVKSRLLQTKSLQIFCYIGALITAMMAMFTKETAITLPLMIVLYEFCFLKNKKSFKVGYLVPFLLTIFIIPVTMVLTETGADRVHQLQIEPGISSMHYLLTQLRVMVTYIRLIFLPFRQNLDYDYPIFQSIFEAPVLVSFLFLMMVFWGALRLFPKYRLVSFSIFWFFLTLLPESSVLPIKDVIFEHRLYLPLVGYGIFLASAVYYSFEKRTIAATIMVLVIAVSCYSFLTYQRNKIWENALTLWNDTVQKSPHKSRLYANRGLAYVTIGDIAQGLSDYNKAIELDPDNAKAYFDRALFYARQNNFLQAVSDYNKALEIVPNASEAYYNRGFSYEKLGDFNQAILDYDKSIELDPSSSEAYNKRGVFYAQRANFSQAVADLTQAIALDPDNEKLYYNRGLCYAKQGDFTQAILDYDQAIRLNPDYLDAYYNRGLSYGKQKNFLLAISDFNKDIEINPKDAGAYNNRAIVYYQLKKYDQAWEDVHKAQALGLAINPKLITALKTAYGHGQ